MAATAIAALSGLALVMGGPAPVAAGQEECSCTETPSTNPVELQVTATNPQDNSRIGPDQETLVVDLRGEQTSLVGEAPLLLAGVDLADVPVLMAVDGGSSGDDPCGQERPAAGANLAITGQVYLEETGPVVWTGACQGTLTVQAAAVTEPSEDTWGRGLVISAVVLAGLAVLCLALIPLTARRRDSEPPRPA